MARVTLRVSVRVSVRVRVGVSVSKTRARTVTSSTQLSHILCLVWQGNLQLITSPIAATDDVLNLFHSKLAPVEVAMPIVLNSIGVAQSDIERAVQQFQRNEQKDAVQPTDGSKKHDTKIESDKRPTEGATPPSD